MTLSHHVAVITSDEQALIVASDLAEDFKRDSAVRDLSNLVFLVLIPALLFRTMSSVRVEQLDTLPLLVYFSAALGLFFVLSVYHFPTGVVGRLRERALR